MLSAKYGGNTFYVGLQKLTGDDVWMRVNGTSGGTLANDSYNSSYDNAKERSWQVRHDYNFVALGIPGLTLMNRYISGDNVHTGTITDGKEWGRESELAYTVQSGALKNLNVKWRNATHPQGLQHQRIRRKPDFHQLPDFVAVRRGAGWINHDTCRSELARDGGAYSQRCNASDIPASSRASSLQHRLRSVLSGCRT